MCPLILIQTESNQSTRLYEFFEGGALYVILVYCGMIVVSVGGSIAFVLTLKLTFAS